MIGHTINNYVIERTLGDGGMGTVYYARHNRVDREVAIKILHSNLFANENIRNRFKNEANALIKLNHPHIVKIYDYVEQDNFACLIMEYISGYTLDDYIAKVSGPMPSSKATPIIRDILDAVQYAHECNIYHRDIKPGNIMISKDGNSVKIMDFGIAKLSDGVNMKTTHANAQLGTPFYMSPEQVKGLPFTRLSDIYSLGVTFFEMVTGKSPYQEVTNLFELQSKIVNEPFPPTHKYYPDVSQRVQRAISIATNKEPAQRFQNCLDFKIYLEQKEKPSATPPKPGLPVEKRIAIEQIPQKKDNSKILYIAGGGIILVILIVLFYKFSKNADPVGHVVAQPASQLSRQKVISDSLDKVKKEDSIINIRKQGFIKNTNKVGGIPTGSLTKVRIEKPKVKPVSPCQTVPTQKAIKDYFLKEKTLSGIPVLYDYQIIIQSVGKGSGKQDIVFKLLDPNNLGKQQLFSGTIKENADCNIISYTRN